MNVIRSLLLKSAQWLELDDKYLKLQSNRLYVYCLEFFALLQSSGLGK